MTSPVPAGTAPTAAGLLSAAGAASTGGAASAGAANGAAGDFLSLVLQMLGATATTPGSGEQATPPTVGDVADAPPATAVGEQATVPAQGPVADAPPTPDPAVAAVLDPALAALMAGLAAGTANPVPAPPAAAPRGTAATGSAGAPATGHVTASSAAEGKGPAAAAGPEPASTSPTGTSPTGTSPTGTPPDATTPAGPVPAVTQPNLAAAGPVPTVVMTTGSAGGTAPAPVAHQVFDRVVEAVRVSDAGPGPTRVTVRLQPESLGEVRVVMSVRDGALQVSLAGSESAHRSLLEGAPELRRLLEAAGAPDVHVVVRDLARGTGVPLVAGATPTNAVTATQPTQPGQGSLDLGAGTQQQSQQPGQQSQLGQQLAAGAGQQGRPSDRRGARPGAPDPIDIPGTATSPRRTDPVTGTRSAGVDVTI